MAETTQEERDYLRRYVNDIEGDEDERAWLLVCIDDADRLAAIERQVLNWADEEMEAARYEKYVDPDRAYRKRCRARRLRALLDPEGD